MASLLGDLAAIPDMAATPDMAAWQCHAMQSRVQDALNAVACCSGPSKQRVANGCMMVHAVLTAVLEWANYQPVIVASVDCLRLMLHYLNTGKSVSQHVNTALHCLTPPCLGCFYCMSCCSSWPICSA